MKKTALIVLGLICILAAAPAGYLLYILTGFSDYDAYAPAYGIIIGTLLLLFGLVCFIKGLTIGSTNTRRSHIRIFMIFWALASVVAIVITSLRLILGRSHLSVEPYQTYVFLVIAVLSIAVIIGFRKRFR